MLTAKIKACLHYCKDLLPVNLVLSFLVAFVGLVYGLPFWKTFSFSLVTAGAFFSSYLYQQRRGHQFYFFYNLGISRRVLHVSALLIDVFLAAGVLLVKNNLR
ncbi:MAG TPA: hypothetical protein VGM89_06030 [Puia sp.]|jgi:hypothetical protein